MTREPIALVLAVVLASGLASGCKTKQSEDEAAPTAPVELAGSGSAGSAGSGSAGSGSGHAAAIDPWASLAELPRVTPLRVVTIPTRPSLPRFTVGGPVLQRELAVVSSSQFGFAAVDWRRGTLVWTKPAGTKVAPPVVHDDSFVLIGDCVAPPTVPDDELLLGCLRVVTPAGTDQAYMAIHGPAAAVEAFAGSAGPQTVWIAPDRRDGKSLHWRRGDEVVTVDLLAGTATPVRRSTGTDSATPVWERPPVVVEYGKRRWEIEHIDGRIRAREGGKPAWAARTEVDELLGAVRIPGQGPMVRMVKISGFAGASEVRILDMDATGSMNGTASWTPVPGISLLGWGISPVGDAALAVRLDTSIKRDFIAAYAASALLLYVYPLPEVLRPDPVGVAVALDDDGQTEAVVVFYDGDQLAVLPDVSAPPTAPGATAGPLQNPTP